MLVAAMLAGCMGDDEGIPAVGAGGDPGLGGTLRWAVDRPAGDVDPLLAASPSGRLVARQIYEPLFERVGGPFDDTRRVNGLALRARPNADRTIWRLVLRQGVQFHDGARFNATAVLANVARWRASAPGRRLLPGLFEVDAPRPHLIRFILSAPDARFDERLGSPRLGIVSPRALGGDPSELAARAVSREAAGTGAFELRERGGGRLLLAPNTAWWGIDRGLGPAIERLEVLTVPDASERLRLLRAGDVQVADGIDREGRRELRDDPLVAVLPQGGGRWRGVERSVRGVTSGREPPAIQQAWLTTLAPN